MTITDKFLADLEAKAKAATQGDWQPYDARSETDRVRVMTVEHENGNWRKAIDLMGIDNTLYIAAAQPAHVLALIAALRDARAETETVRHAAEAVVKDFLEAFGK